MNPYHNEQSFSIHTFEIRMRCSNKADYYLAFSRLWKFCEKHNRRMYDPNKKKSVNDDVDINHSLCDTPGDSNTGDKSKCGTINEVVVSEALTIAGMTVIFVRHRVGGVPVYYGIRLVINPRRLLGDDTYVGVFDIKRVEELFDAINTAFKYLGISHLSLDSFRLHRIDLCRNVFLDSQEMVETYIELLKKCFVPDRYSWNEVNGIEFGIKLKDGVRISNECVAVVVYNKKAQMIKQNGYYSPVDIAEAECLLRFEIQLYEYKIRNLCKQDSALRNLYNFFRSCEALCIQHFEYYIPMIFLRGNYYTHEDAKIIIERNIQTAPLKKKMVTLLDSVTIHRNLMTALDDVVRMYNPRNPYNFVRELLQHFDSINLNPVTIPRRRDIAGEMFLESAYNRVMGIDTVMFNILD